MKTLKTYFSEAIINNTEIEELPEPIWNSSDIEKFYDKAKKQFNFDAYGDEVSSIDGSELSYRNVDKTFKPGDIVYYDIIPGTHVYGVNTVKDQPVQIVAIFKNSGSNTNMWSGAPYVLCCVDAASHFYVRPAQDFFNCTSSQNENIINRRK